MCVKKGKLTLKLGSFERLENVLGQLRVHELGLVDVLGIEERHVVLLDNVDGPRLARRLEADALLVGEHEQRQIEYVAGGRGRPRAQVGRRIHRLLLLLLLVLLWRLTDQVAEELDLLVGLELLDERNVVVEDVAGLRGRHDLEHVLGRVLLERFEHVSRHDDHWVVGLRVDAREYVLEAGVVLDLVDDHVLDGDVAPALGARVEELVFGNLLPDLAEQLGELLILVQVGHEQPQERRIFARDLGQVFEHERVGVVEVRELERVADVEATEVRHEYALLVLDVADDGLAEVERLDEAGVARDEIVLVAEAQVLVAVVRDGNGELHEEVVGVEETHRVGEYGEYPLGALHLGLDLLAQRDHDRAGARKLAVGDRLADLLVLVTELLHARVLHIDAVDLLHLLLLSAVAVAVAVVLGATELNVANVLGEEHVQVRLLHEVLGVEEYVLDMDELARHAARARLGAQRQADDGAVVVARLEQRHVEDLLQRLELVLELLDVLVVLLEVEDGHVAALVGRQALVRVDKGDPVAAEDGHKVRYVKERDELARLLRAATSG